MQFSQAMVDKLREVHGIEFFRLGAEWPKSKRNVPIERFCRLHGRSVMPFGSWSYASGVFGPVSRIGRYCSIAPGVRVTSHEHPVSWMSTSPSFYDKAALGVTADDVLPEYEPRPEPVEIGNDVWIGQDVLLRSGITIGDGAVIASGSVVTKDVAAYDIVGGAPARVIRKRFDEDVIAGLQELAWWRFAPDVFRGLDVSDPRSVIADFPKYAEPIPEVRKTLLGWLNSL